MTPDTIFLDAAATAFTLKDEADGQRLRTLIERAMREGVPADAPLIVLDGLGVGEFEAASAALAAVGIQALLPSPFRPQVKRRGEG